MPLQPPPNPNAVNPPAPTARRALGYTAGYIRDRTRAIRKEFAIQSSWGHDEAISCFERIARWHILCLRELQEETGSNTDMHIDSAELGRAFTSLRQHYNDRREELRVDMPCPNEPEFRAYMLIYDLNNKSVSIPISELPSVILNHPLVQLAFQIRQAAQRNFDSQKEGSKLNAELGANLITRFVRLLKQGKVPYLLSCLVEIRLREMRRSAIRALTRTYPKFKQGQGPTRQNENGEVVERRMILMAMLNGLLGAEEQEDEETAWDDVFPTSKNPNDESVDIVERFGIEVYKDHTGPVGALINHGSRYNDNKDAPFTRRWKFISQKKGTSSYSDVVNGRAGVAVDGGAATAAVTTTSTWQPPPKVTPPVQRAPVVPVVSAPTGTSTNGAAAGAFAKGGAFTGGSAFAAPSGSSTGAFSNGSAFSKGSAFANGSAAPTTQGPSAFSQPTKTPPAVGAFAFNNKGGSAFAPSGGFTPPAVEQPKPTPPATPSVTISAPPSTTPVATPPAIPSFFGKKEAPAPSTTPKAPPPSVFPSFSKVQPPPAAKVPTLFDDTATARPSKRKTVVSTPSISAPNPSFFPSAAPPTGPTAAPPPAQASPPTFSAPTFAPRPSPLAQPVKKPVVKPPTKPEIPKIKISRDVMRLLPSQLRDRLVEQVVANMVQDRMPMLEKINHERVLAHEYVEERKTRQEVLQRAAPVICQTMLNDYIAVLAKEMYEREKRIRARVKDAALHWRRWAARRLREREQFIAKRERNFAMLSGQGLSRSMASFDSKLLDVSRRQSVASLGSVSMSRAPSALSSSSAMGSTMPEVEIVLELHQAENARLRLFEKTSFLHAIARHVAPLIQPSEEDPEPLWETILLTAEHSGTPANAQARQWLASKFIPKAEELHSDGVDFIASTADVHGDLPGSVDTGLFVFEAPLETFNSRSMEFNADDANDRLAAASGRLQQGARYHSALLLLTWQDESFDELVERLQIQDAVAEFEHVDLVCIDGMEDLDDRFARAVRALVPREPRKKQVVLPMVNVVYQLEQPWTDYVLLVANILAQFPSNGKLIATVVTETLTALSAVRESIQAEIDDLPVSHLSTYDATPLPPLDIQATDIPGVVTALSEYLSLPIFGGVDDIALAVGPLRLGAVNGTPLPILPVLHALSNVVFSQLERQTLKLDQWFVPPHHGHATGQLASRMCQTMFKAFHAASNRVAAARSSAQAQAEARLKQEQQAKLALAKRTPLPPSPPKASQRNKGTKRSIDETGSPASKSAKTARLLHMLAEVKSTMNQLDAGMSVEWQRVE